MIPPLATIKLWLIGAAVAAFGVMIAVIKFMSVKAELKNEQLKAKGKQIENMAEASKLQAESIRARDEASEIEESINAASADDNRAELLKHSRD